MLMYKPFHISHFLYCIITVTALPISIKLVSVITITEEGPWHIDTDLLTSVCLITLTFINF